MTATANARPGRLERRKARTRAAIIDAASSLFHTQGFENTPIQQIAERADTGVGTLYGYFDSKDQILREVLRVHSDEALAHYNAVVRPDTPHIDRVVAGLATLAEYIRDHRSVLLAAFQLAGRSRSTAEDEDTGDWLVGAYKHMLREGIAEGGLADVPVDATARMLIGTCFQAMLHVGVWQATPDDDRAFDDIEQIVRQMLTPRAQ
ncbi:TetR/AcrR family transcriptional regulator [bacterium]|jgi:AcrR family transcriptional regulator|nr:TetR/AcrR family transcriptional regulator [bacterium]